jgi:hypothetical protein
MATRLMHGLRSALHRGWQQGCDALHPAPRPTLLEALRDTYLTTAHTVTQLTQDAERMEYPQFRARLLQMAAEEQGHVTWLRETLLARGGALPTRACPKGWCPVKDEEGVMGMSRQLFVWSLAPGPHAGDPCEHTSGQRAPSRKPRHDFAYASADVSRLYRISVTPRIFIAWL